MGIMQATGFIQGASSAFKDGNRVRAENQRQQRIIDCAKRLLEKTEKLNARKRLEIVACIDEPYIQGRLRIAKTQTDIWMVLRHIHLRFDLSPREKERFVDVLVSMLENEKPDAVHHRILENQRLSQKKPSRQSSTPQYILRFEGENSFELGSGGELNFKALTPKGQKHLLEVSNLLRLGQSGTISVDGQNIRAKAIPKHLDEIAKIDVISKANLQIIPVVQRVQENFIFKIKDLQWQIPALFETDILTGDISLKVIYRQPNISLNFIGTQSRLSTKHTGNLNFQMSDNVEFFVFNDIPVLELLAAFLKTCELNVCFPSSNKSILEMSGIDLEKRSQLSSWLSFIVDFLKANNLLLKNRIIENKLLFPSGDSVYLQEMHKLYKRVIRAFDIPETPFKGELSVVIDKLFEGSQNHIITNNIIPEITFSAVLISNEEPILKQIITLRNAHVDFSCNGIQIEAESLSSAFEKSNGNLELKLTGGQEIIQYESITNEIGS